MTQEQFEDIAEEAFHNLPEKFKEAIDNVEIGKIRQEVVKDSGHSIEQGAAARLAEPANITGEVADHENTKSEDRRENRRRNAGKENRYAHDNRQLEQNEIDNLTKGLNSDNKGDENITWDDVKEDMEASKKQTKTTASTANFEELQNTEQKSSAAIDIDFILDIPLTVTVELGRARMLIGELLQLGQGSIVELAKFAGEPMDVFINQRLIAKGEVVVVNEKFGIRLTDIASPAERVGKLK